MKQLDNTRAFSIIDKSNLGDAEKRFLRTHIEMFGEMWESCQAENLTLKDIIDYGRFIDDSYMKHKENLIVIIRDIQILIDNLRKGLYNVKNKNGEDIRQTVIPDRLLLLLGMLEDYNEKEEDVNNENAES